MLKSKYRSKRKSQSFIKTLFSDVDKTFLISMGILLLFGIIMIYNSTVIYAQGALGGAYTLVFQQIAWVLIGLVGFVVFYSLDLKLVRRYSFPIFIVALAFLGFLALTSLFSGCSDSVIFAPCVNGAHRWFYLNPAPLPTLPLIGILGFQPSEFAKLALIMYLAAVLEKHIKEKGEPFKIFITVAGLVAGLVLLQPNMSTATLLFMIGVVIYFVSTADLMPLLITLPTLFVAGVGFILSSSYRRARLLTFLNPGDSGDLSLGYHIKQIQIALGSGGVFGVGFGQSRQKFQYLPEVAADSIFAVIGEEFGYVGTVALIILFSLLIYRILVIAMNSRDIYSRMLVSGVAAWLAGQFFINIAAMTRVIPLTGVPLPLISYGGSSLVFSMLALGLVANVSSRS